MYNEGMLAKGVCPVGNHAFEYEMKRGKKRTYCSEEHAFKATAHRARLRNAQLTERTCPRCGDIKDSSEFAGVTSPYCKPCMAAYSREQRQLKGIDPVYTRMINLRRYNMTPESFAALLKQQAGRCAICQTKEPGSRGWHVDHDHACCNTRKKSCGKCLRGILCSHCNIGIGNFFDDPEIIRAALEYLTFHRNRRSKDA